MDPEIVFAFVFLDLNLGMVLVYFPAFFPSTESLGVRVADASY